MRGKTGSTETNGPTIHQWRNAVMVEFALGGLTMATWGPRMADLRADLGIGNGGIGLVLAGVAVGSIIGLTASSAVLSRLGSRRSIRVMFLLIALGTATIGLGAGIAHSVAMTTVGFVCVGFGIGAVDVMVNLEGSAVEQAARRTLMPLLHAAWSAGAIAGAGIGAAGALLRVPVEEQFVGQAALVVVAAGVAARFLPPTVRAQGNGRRQGITQRLGMWLRGWGDGRLLLIGLVMLGVELGEGTANSWLTLAVRDGHHRPGAVAALFYVAFAVGETLARVVGGPLVDRFGRVLAVRCTTALGVIGIFVFIVATPAWLILIGTLLWAVGVSLGFPLGMSAAAESGANPAARVSLVASIGYLANLAGPPLIGFLSQTIGLLHALWAVVALLAIGFAASEALRARRITVPATGSHPSA